MPRRTGWMGRIFTAEIDGDEAIHLPLTASSICSLPMLKRARELSFRLITWAILQRHVSRLTSLQGQWGSPVPHRLCLHQRPSPLMVARRPRESTR